MSDAKCIHEVMKVIKSVERFVLIWPWTAHFIRLFDPIAIECDYIHEEVRFIFRETEQMEVHTEVDSKNQTVITCKYKASK